MPRGNQNFSAEAYLNTLRANQNTGLVDPALMIAPKRNANAVKDGDESYPIYWKSMGPDNMGGRTTAVFYNNQNTNEAFIGSMGGGVFYTWNKGITWHQVGDNLMVSCMAQAEDGTIYVGTGDGGAAYSYNSLADYNYTNSFLGSGLYMINKDREMSLVAGTSPVDVNDPEDEWAFINDIALDGNTVVVATNAGVRYLKDGEWVYAQVVDTTAETGYVDLTGKAVNVKVGAKVEGSDKHILIASVDKKFYVGTLDKMECKSASGSDDEIDEETEVITAIGVAKTLLDIAINPEDNTIYAANIDSKGNHIAFYITENLGETWEIILPTVDEEIGHQVYGGLGNFNHGIVLDPLVPGRFYVTAKDLWVVEKQEDSVINQRLSGLYVAAQVSNAEDLLTGEPNLHIGLNAMVFNPKNGNEVYVGTDGGIYKGTRAPGNKYFTFVNCNRGFISTRCLGVAPSGNLTRVAAGALDFGPILINGLEGTNNMTTGDVLQPESENGHVGVYGGHFGIFEKTNNCGFCAVSTIQPDAIIMTTADGGIHRTKTAGVDYDISNFNTSFGISHFQLPMAYWETFYDEYSTNEVWFKCNKDMKAGDSVVYYSNTGDYPSSYPNAGYPLHGVLPIDLHFNAEHPDKSDSVSFPDPINTKLFFPKKVDTKKYEIYYSTDGIRFGKLAEWNKIGTITGTNNASCPTCMTISADGDNLFVGTLSAGIGRFTNLRHAVDSATFTPTSSEFAPVYKQIELPASVNKRCITSIAVYPDDPNKIVVTLGNYGNGCYILYSDNALSDEPTFTEKQGDLLAMPVYSSVYTSTYDRAENGHVLIGTEHGVYRTTDIAAESPVWVKVWDNMGDVPVMELRQQLIQKDEEVVYVELDSVNTKRVVYPGTNNQGVIYAATYGRGLFRCETYRQHSATGISETSVATESKISVYPNPVRDAAKVSFELKNNATVSYQVYDMNGRMVSTESLGNFTEGKHEVSVDVDGLAKGAYVLRLNAGSQTSSVKFMVF